MVAHPGASCTLYLFEPPWAPKVGDLYERVSFGVNKLLAAGNAIGILGRCRRVEVSTIRGHWD